MQTRTIEDEYGTLEVKFEDSQDTKEAVFAAILAWYFKHKSFNGETICQCDDPSIDAQNIVSDIADKIIKFDVNEIEQV